MSTDNAALTTREYEAEEIERAAGRERLPAVALARPAQSTLASIRQTQSVSQLLPAFARAQMAFPPIAKDRVAKIEGRGNYTYRYANLADVQTVVNPILQENKLSFMMVPTGTRLVGRLIHESGEYIEGDLPIVQADSRGGAQALGSALTYAKRYLMSSMLGLVLDDFDDDGAAASDARSTPVAAARDPGAHTGHRAKGPGLSVPSAADLGAAVEQATKPGPCEEALRYSAGRPRLRFAAYAKLVALASNTSELRGVDERIRADPEIDGEPLVRLGELLDRRESELSGERVIGEEG